MSCKSCNPPAVTLQSNEVNCCPTSFCHDMLLSLPETRRMPIVGVPAGSKCMHVFPRALDGFVIQDGLGGAIVTRQPQVNVPFLKSYLVDQNGDPIWAQDGTQAEDLPPGIKSLVGMSECGLMWRITGQKGKRQEIYWDGCKYVHKNADGLLEEQDLPSVNDGLEDCEYYSAVFIRNADGTLKIGYRNTHYRYPGEIIAFGGTRGNMPNDCLACDGSFYSPDEFPDLFSAIGYNWGRSGDNFAVPLLEGLFPRGVDHGRGNDANAGGRSPTQAGGNSGDNVGSLQQDAFQCHEHSLPYQTGAGGAAEAFDSNSNQTVGAIGVLNTNGVQTSTCGTARTANETRPKNVAVEYMVYAGCQQ